MDAGKKTIEQSRFAEQIIQTCQVELRAFPILPSLIFVVTLILTHILMKFVIMWRLLLVVSRREESPMREKHERKNSRQSCSITYLWYAYFVGCVINSNFVSCHTRWQFSHYCASVACFSFADKFRHRPYIFKNP